MLNAFKEYFSFSKKELNGILILCVLISLVLLAPMFFSLFQQPEKNEFGEFDKEISKFYASIKEQPVYDYRHLQEETEQKKLRTEYFLFDPNNLSKKSWKRLGLTDRQINVIKNFESKGGKFYKKEDLKKIYTISGQDYARLEPYIKIENQFSKHNASYPLPDKPRRINLAPVAVIEINSADSAQLETLRGIGPAFASRIIRYRNRLGGFYAKEQLREVYGLDSVKYASLKEQIKVDVSSIQKLNINTAVFEDLKRHPYLSYKQMNAIIQYRNQHGKYSSVADLRKVVILNGEILRKIEPYITF